MGLKGLMFNIMSRGGVFFMMNFAGETSRWGIFLSGWRYGILEGRDFTS